MQELSAARRTAKVIALAAMTFGQLGVPAVLAQSASGDDATRTPIKHVLYIIGENRSFDHLFGTFVPDRGQRVWNLLSEGIVNSDGSPGPNFKQAQQWQALDTGTFSIHPTKASPYLTLPPPNTDGAPTSAPFSSISDAQAVEPALPSSDYWMLITGGTGLAKDVIDTRFPASLPNAPFDITNWISYNDYAGSPVHRLFQMWQQMDCNVATATLTNPSGCQMDLFPWVEISVGAGSNGKAPPAGFDPNNSAYYEVTNEGAISMGFYNNYAGDVGYFDQLAHQYALSDNYHQAVAGGTGANHIAVGYGAMMYYDICNPFLYSTQIMTSPALRANLKGIRDLYSDITNGTLPAVAIVKPDGYLDGHPASSKFGLFEDFCRKIIGMIQSNPSLWKDTAIMITTDEGGGYYDSGYVQPIDFFGDGTRIPLIVVSPYSAGVGVVHSYGDHVSFDKFVEANWQLPPINANSRDNLPNPIASRANPWVPTNGPALSDLMTMFKFGKGKGG